MNSKKHISSIDLDRLLIFEGGRDNYQIHLKEDVYKYARIQNQGSAVAYLSWIEGVGKGNILMLGVLQQMIRLQCDTLITQISPRSNTSLVQLERFYSQFGLTRNKSISDEYGRNMFGGKPFSYMYIDAFIKRVEKIL